MWSKGELKADIGLSAQLLVSLAERLEKEGDRLEKEGNRLENQVKRLEKLRFITRAY